MDQQLEYEDNGPYALLSARANPKKLIIVFEPALGVWLTRAEQHKGSALSETECLRIRDRAPAVALDKKQLKKLALSRGYVDIKPEDVYGQWTKQKRSWLEPKA